MLPNHIKISCCYGFFWPGEDQPEPITEPEDFEGIPQKVALNVAIRYVKFLVAVSKLEDSKHVGTALFTNAEELSPEGEAEIHELIYKELSELGVEAKGPLLTIKF